MIRNPKYLPNKKNRGIPPVPDDYRKKWVPIGCGKCIQCRKQRANSWYIRLERELKLTPKAVFVTLTFNEESLQKLKKEIEMNQENEASENQIAKVAVKRFRERWRKKYKTSIKHWLITEKGHDNGRIHMHGILFNAEAKEIDKIWSYGWTYCGTYCNGKSIRYITKYVTKLDKEHPDFEGKILTSPGIGNNNFEKSTEAFISRYNGKETNERYRMQNGQYYALPMYLRNKIYTERQKENLWMFKLNKPIRYVNGIEIDISTEAGEKKFYETLTQQQAISERLGFGKPNRPDKEKSDDFRKQSVLRGLPQSLRSYGGGSGQTHGAF